MAYVPSTICKTYDPAGFNDLYRYNPTTATWTKFAHFGSVPSVRYAMGFVATSDSELYVFGGADEYGMLPEPQYSKTPSCSIFCASKEKAKLNE